MQAPRDHLVQLLKVAKTVSGLRQLSQLNDIQHVLNKHPDLLESQGALKAEGGVQQLWHATLALQQQAGALLASHANPGVWLQAAKFIEHLAEAIKQPCFTKEQRALHAMAFRAYLGGVIMDSAKARKNGVAQPTGGFLKGLRSTEIHEANKSLREDTHTEAAWWDAYQSGADVTTSDIKQAWD
eukprot:jgi/Astpho2/3602/Aster-06896